MITELVVATTNEGKLRELRELLRALPIRIRSVKEVLGRNLEVEETGETFEANAALKARAVCEATGLPTLADDSGLEVDALGGRPGVHSARFAGPDATDAENRAALREALASVTDSEPRARFRCALAFLAPGRESSREDLRFFSGHCEGHVLRQERGNEGFGYDAMFVPEGEGGRTMAELPMEVKNRISHRAKAFSSFLVALQTLQSEA